MPIPGARSITHLEENAAAVDVALDPADVDAVEAIFSATSVQGARYAQGDFDLIESRARRRGARGANAAEYANSPRGGFSFCD